MIEKLLADTSAPLNLAQLFVNLMIGFALGLILKFKYEKLNTVLGNKKQFSIILPFVVGVVILIITVVKSSLALSLGLVGALSIVRFRTPIKEPEDIVYLFFAIAIGLGLGANQVAATVLSSLCIFAFYFALKWKTLGGDKRNFFLSLHLPKTGDDTYSRLSGILKDYSRSVDLKRFDTKEKSTSTLYQIHIETPDILDDLIKKLKGEFPSIEITFNDFEGLPFV